MNDKSEINMFGNLPISEQEARNLSPVALAFVGDAVHSLFVRTKITRSGKENAATLHRNSSKVVKASAQSDTIEKLLSFLTEDEIYIYKRGRNSKTTFSAKNASMIDYRRATGFETLLGYLYLSGNLERLKEILSLTTSEENK